MMRDQLASLELPQNIDDTFGKYRDDPVGFCREVLGVESATRRSDGEPYQFTVLEDVATTPRVAVRSGHGVGKSTTDAWATIWWLVTRPLSRVIVLAPEYSRQVRAILFSEMRKWVRRSKVPLPLTVYASRAIVEGFGEEWSATGMSTAGDVDRLEGFHAEGGVLVILDEVKGIPMPAMDAVQGALSGLEDSRLLVTSVPGGAGSGPFWKACSDPERWKVHHIPSTDSSNVSPEWCEDRAKDWGKGSPLYQCRVDGDFADAGEGVLFPLPLIEAAVNREVETDTGDALGVDVARSAAGDLNCVARYHRGRVEIVATWRSPDTMETVEKVTHVVTLTGCKHLAVDVGGVGGGVVDRLRQLGHDVHAVHFGGASDDPQRFRNWRAAAFWGLREAMEKGEVSLPDDDELRADLSALRYQFNADGRIQIEGKDDCRKRLGHSPDRADAVVLALAKVGASVHVDLTGFGAAIKDTMTEGETWGSLDPDGRPASAGPWL